MIELRWLMLPTPVDENGHVLIWERGGPTLQYRQEWTPGGPGEWTNWIDVPKVAQRRDDD